MAKNQSSKRKKRKRSFLEEKQRKDECHYHLCRKRGKLSKCPYCGGKYCPEHTEPYKPEYGERLISGYGSEGHPCGGYHRLVDERNKEWGDKIEAAYKKSALKRAEENRTPQTVLVKKSAGLLSYLLYSDFWGKIKLGLLLLTLGFCLVWVSGILLHHYDGGCYGGFESGECFDEKPYYCLNGTFIENPIKCGCPNYTTFNGINCIRKCGETISGRCTENRPYQCINGTLVKNATKCGCPDGFWMEGDDCIEPTCEDGTKYGKCSSDKPHFCSQGVLIKDATQCGCPSDYVVDGDDCISKFSQHPKEVTLEYVVHSEEGEIEFTVYGGLDQHLSSLSRYYTCNPDCPTNEEMQLFFLQNEVQREHLIELVNKITAESSDPDMQGRIAISLVQSIPYDWQGLSGQFPERYPYEVVYDNRGICGEKSKLLAFLLKELGYGVVLFNYDQHMAVGIKCPAEYDYLDSGYCFVETTSPSIITDSKGEYLMIGELTGVPDIYQVSTGKSLGGVEEEYNDAREFDVLVKYSELYESLDYTDYARVVQLVEKYGLDVELQE